MSKSLIMAKLKLRGKDLLKIGFPQGKVVGIALGKMQQYHKKKSKQWVLDALKDVLENPEKYLGDEVMGTIVEQLIEPVKVVKQELTGSRAPHKIYGEDFIEESAKDQLYTALKLPVAVEGALMPDAHHGYGLPIGGVLATDNAVIPYGVGVDIGCRMCLTMYDMPVGLLKGESEKFKRILLDNTCFGGKEVFSNPYADKVLERDEFKDIKVVRDLKDRAYKQMGTSGGGNHFVEFGVVEILGEDNEFGLPVGEYLGLLSHSGSRGLGANIARHYTKVAKDVTPLPKVAQHLAWLNLDTQEGEEYWLAMNLAGDYASACHHDIHRRIGKAIGERPLATVENHHNFAWKEKLEDGREVIVHRKGATPAGKGVLGIIPGSMATHGFIVRGKGERASLNSASHGAGRVMSRTKAKGSLTKSYVDKFLRDNGVELIGGGLDEAPMAYKNIHEVMAQQVDLVGVLGTFLPKIVRMEGN